jgi:hypothetical protein
MTLSTTELQSDGESYDLPPKIYPKFMLGFGSKA